MHAALAFIGIALSIASAATALPVAPANAPGSIDQSDPPIVLESNEYGGGLFDMVAVDSLVYGVSGHRILVFDVSDEKAAMLVGMSDPIGEYGAFLSSIETSAGQLLVSNNFQLWRVSIADPLQPRTIDSVEVLGSIMGSAALNAYVIDSDRLSIVSVDPLEPPAVIGTTALAGRALDAVILPQERLLYLTESSLHALDVSDPSNVFDTAQLDSYGATAVAARDSWIFLIGRHETCGFDPCLIMMDASDATTIRVAGTGVLERSDRVHLLGVSPNAAIVTVAHGSGLLRTAYSLELIDVSEPASPQPIAKIELPGLTLPRASAYIGDLLLTARTYGIESIDIGDLPNPVHLRTTQLLLAPSGVCPIGNRWLAFNWEQRAWLIDSVAEPPASTSSDLEYMGEQIWDTVACSEDWAYAAITTGNEFQNDSAPWSQVAIVDIAGPVPGPTRIVLLPDSKEVQAVATWDRGFVTVESDYADTFNLRVWEHSPFGSLGELGRLNLEHPGPVGMGLRIQAVGRMLAILVSGSPTGTADRRIVHIVDILDDGQPMLRSTISTIPVISDIDLQKNLLAVLSPSEDAVLLFDVRGPRIIGKHMIRDDLGNAPFLASVALDGARAFVSGYFRIPVGPNNWSRNEARIWAIDFSNPTRPTSRSEIMPGIGYGRLIPSEGGQRLGVIFSGNTFHELRIGLEPASPMPDSWYSLSLPYLTR